MLPSGAATTAPRVPPPGSWPAPCPSSTLLRGVCREAGERGRRPERRCAGSRCTAFRGCRERPPLRHGCQLALDATISHRDGAAPAPARPTPGRIFPRPFQTGRCHRIVTACVARWSGRSAVAVQLVLAASLLELPAAEGLSDGPVPGCPTCTRSLLTRAPTRLAAVLPGLRLSQQQVGALRDADNFGRRKKVLAVRKGK